MKNTKYQNGKEIEKVGILSRNDLINTINGINEGLATQELLTLIGLYKSLIYLEDTLDKDSEPYLKATIKKCKVEYDLYREIVRGYKKCYVQLGLNQYSNIKEWEITDDYEIKIKYDVK